LVGIAEKSREKRRKSATGFPHDTIHACRKLHPGKNTTQRRIEGLQLKASIPELNLGLSLRIGNFKA